MGIGRAAEGRPTPPEVYNYRIYLLSFLACLGSWMFGYNNGVIAGVLVLPSFFREFKLPTVGTAEYNYITSTIVSLLQIGGFIGAVGTFPVMKYWGRKLALVVAALFYFTGAALQVCPFGSCNQLFTSNQLSRFSKYTEVITNQMS